LITINNKKTTKMSGNYLATAPDQEVDFDECEEDDGGE